MAELGFTETTSLTDEGANANYAWYSEDTTDASGGVTAKFYVYTKNTAGSDKHIYCAVYEDDSANDQPGAMVGDIVTITVPALSPEGWYNTDYVETLAASTSYWVVYVNDGCYNYTKATGTGNSGYFNLGDTTLDDPFDAGAESIRTWESIAYVTYAASGGIALAGGISGASSTNSFLPYIYHYLVNNVVSGAASLNTLLPYIYHYLVNNAVSAVSSLSNFLPYLYHYLVDNIVSGATTLYGNIVITSEQIIHALAGAVNAISSLPSLLPQIFHYLINNTVAAVSSISNTLPYIMHRLLSDTFAAVSSTVGNLETFGEGVLQVLAGAVDAVSSTFGSLQLFGIRLFTAAVDGVSTIIGNLTKTGGSAINKLRIYMKIHRGRF